MERKVYEHISKQTNDPIVERKVCKISETEFPIYQSDLDFYDKISPVFNGVKYSIPTPTLCPEERMRRRMARRNERKLYKRTCDASGKQVISIYSPDKGYKVYDQKIRRSDQWDPTDYKMEFDLKKTFLKQFKELSDKIPKSNLFIFENENSSYVNLLGYSKDCYLSYSGTYNENCYYSCILNKSTSCVDCLETESSENCYESININGSSNIFYSSNISHSNNIYYSQDCIGCSYCIGCIGLKNKKNFIFNKECTKEEIDQWLNNIDENSVYQNLKDISLKVPKKNGEMESCENCYGNDLSECKNCFSGYNLKRVNDSKYLDRVYGSSSIHDSYGTGNSELLYEVMSTSQGSYFSAFCNACRPNSKYLFYCNDCHNCSHCFGCVGLRDKEYYILNKKYTKDEYHELVPKIINHMQKTEERGEFFSPDLSPFGYNETIAQEHFPLTKEKAATLGYNWSNYGSPSPHLEKIMHGQDVPRNIKEIDDSILTKTIACEITEKPFRIIKPELDFYRKYNLPIPHKHPDIRYQARMESRPGKELFMRTCNKCKEEMISVYPQGHEQKIYCESCYNKEILG